MSLAAHENPSQISLTVFQENSILSCKVSELSQQLEQLRATNEDLQQENRTLVQGVRGITEVTKLNPLTDTFILLKITWEYNRTLNCSGGAPNH